MDTYEISEDGQMVTVTADGIDTVFSLAQVEQMITFFGIIRHQMNPPVPVEANELTLFRPALHVMMRHVSEAKKPLEQGAVFQFQSSQFGWFDCPMSPEFCQGLVHWLLAQPEAILPPPGTTLN